MMEERSQYSRIEQIYHLANIWHLKGSIANAEANYRQVLAMDPSHIQALKKLGLLMLTTGRFKDAKEYYSKAVTLDPQDYQVGAYLEYIDALEHSNGETIRLPVNTVEHRPLPDNPGGKIKIEHTMKWSYHRSGWEPAINALTPFHSSQGVLIDTAVEANFGLRHWKNWVNPDSVLEQMKKDGTFEACTTSEEKGMIPYLEPWIGFLHNSHEMPKWYEPHLQPQTIFKKEVWQKSLENCVGLFTLSEHFAKWVRKNTGKPVSSLFHPTEIPEVKFDFDLFMDNKEKLIVQIGFWLRSLTAISQLPLTKHNPVGYKKVRLLQDHSFGILHENIIRQEIANCGISIAPEYEANTTVTGPLSNSEYDEMLSRNLAFLCLHDAAANNTVVECIARATPLLVNPLPGVVEYLGPDYPLYYRTLEEAAQKALDLKLIRQTHKYLLNYGGKEKITWDYFVDGFTSSQVYKAL